MATTEIETFYKCSGNCTSYYQECKGHTLKTGYQSTADIFSFSLNNQERVYWDSYTRKAFFKAFAEHARSRVELQDDIQDIIKLFNHYGLMLGN